MILKLKILKYFSKNVKNMFKYLDKKNQRIFEKMEKNVSTFKEKQCR